MHIKRLARGTALALLLAMPALAQDQSNGMDHSAHQSMETGAPKGDQGPASQAFAQANARMHAGMNFAFSGNADVDFVRGMIAHHQGAIDMARVELEYGKDPAIRRLAEEVIRAQQAEIEMMKTWLEQNAK